jgi:hypothetical protein
MECTYGIISDIFYIGVNPSNMADKDTCSPSDENELCTLALNLTFLEIVKSNVTSDQSSAYEYAFSPSELWNSSMTLPDTCGTSSSKTTLYA